MQLWARLHRVRSNVCTLGAPLGAAAECALPESSLGAIDTLREHQGTGFELAWPALRADLGRLLPGGAVHMPTSAAEAPSEASVGGPATLTAAASTAGIRLQRTAHGDVATGA